MNFEEKRKKVVKKVQRKTWFKCLKEQFLISHEKGIVPVICALLVLIPLGIVLYASYKKNTDEISYILAMISLFTSVSFELYEWFYLFGKRDVSKKVLTFPCIIDFVLPESVKLIVFICQSTIRLAKSRKCTLIMLNKPVLM